MSTGGSLLAEFDAEMAATRRLLERVPEDKGDWRPHEKSMPLGRLSTHLAELPIWAVNSLQAESVDIANFTPVILASTAEKLALFDKNASIARAALAGAADEDFGKPWSLMRGGKVMFTTTRGATFRTFTMNHMIHHRAQLGVYLRLLDIPLPGTYGPTADERPGG
jgi:uncharacterized damage-inducible protein DinB